MTDPALSNPSTTEKKPKNKYTERYKQKRHDTYMAKREELLNYRKLRYEEKKDEILEYQRGKYAEAKDKIQQLAIFREQERAEELKNLKLRISDLEKQMQSCS